MNGLVISTPQFQGFAAESEPFTQPNENQHSPLIYGTAMRSAKHSFNKVQKFNKYYKEFLNSLIHIKFHGQKFFDITDIFHNKLFLDYYFPIGSYIDCVISFFNNFNHIEPTWIGIGDYKLKISFSIIDLLEFSDFDLTHISAIPIIYFKIQLFSINEKHLDFHKTRFSIDQIDVRCIYPPIGPPN